VKKESLIQFFAPDLLFQFWNSEQQSR